MFTETRGITGAIHLELQQLTSPPSALNYQSTIWAYPDLIGL